MNKQDLIQMMQDCLAATVPSFVVLSVNNATRGYVQFVGGGQAPGLYAEAAGPAWATLTAQQIDSLEELGWQPDPAVGNYSNNWAPKSYEQLSYLAEVVAQTLTLAYGVQSAQMITYTTGSFGDDGE